MKILVIDVYEDFKVSTGILEMSSWVDVVMEFLSESKIPKFYANNFGYMTQFKPVNMLMKKLRYSDNEVTCELIFESGDKVRRVVKKL